jgi:parallel beta-helix repeat protein
MSVDTEIFSALWNRLGGKKSTARCVGLIALCTGALVAAPGYAADAYVRPATDCAYNGDGTQPTCAAGANGAGAFRTLGAISWAGKGAGDTLYVIGEHIGSSLNVSASGSTTTPLTIRGDLFGYAPGVIDGAGTLTQCVVQQGTAKDLSFVSLIVKNCTNRGFVFPSMANETTHLGLQLHNVVVSGITSTNPSDTPTCLWARGEDIVIKDSRFEGCEDDGIWVRGTNLTFENNWFEALGAGTNNHADCIQLAYASDNFRLRRNTCNHVIVNPKQCFIVNTDLASHTGSSHGEITDNVCIMPKNDGVLEMKGIFNIHPNVLIARNLVVNGRQGIWQMAVNGTLIANVVTGFYDTGIYVGNGSQSTVLNNTVVGPGSGLCINSASSSTFINNVVVKCQRGIKSGTGTNLWESNLAWGNTYNTPELGTGVNTINNMIYPSTDPGFSGPELYDADAWRMSLTTSGYDVSSYGTPALLDFHKNPRSSGDELGAFTP